MRVLGLCKLLASQKYLINNTRSVSNSIRIGCASGFWGDTATSVTPLVQHGNLDYLVFDYLSEITMSILASQKKKAPDMGYTADFVQFAMAPNLTEIKKKGIKVISNAGGINPESCAHALTQLASNLGLSFKIAVITGDDLMPQVNEIEKSGITEMKSGESFPKNITSMNAYLGAGPIAKALNNGADIVITGRCVDSAVTLAPLIKHFNWKLNDWDKLCAGSLAGHLIECGAQSTGGIHTDWHLVRDMHNMGFPIAECYEDGTFKITKPSNTGGFVSVGTVSEQLVYEIGDPAAYYLPDVTCDFTSVKISQCDDNSVFVEGAKGKPPSDYYKVSATYSDGFRATALSPIVGPNCVEKAKITAEAIIKRAEMVLNHIGMGKFRRTHVEVLGAGYNYGQPEAKHDPREVVLWMAVHHDKKEAIGVFGREIAASSTGGAPGFTTLPGGRPKASSILKLFSFLYPKEKVQINISMGDVSEDYKNPSSSDKGITSDDDDTSKTTQDTVLKTGKKSYRLGELAFTRSGDKGDTCNIGVVARHPSYFPYIAKQLTTDSMAKYFQHLFTEKGKANVLRYTLPGINAFNFVLENALGGGGVASLRSDPQGKACGQVLSDFILHDMPDLEEIKKN